MVKSDQHLQTHHFFSHPAGGEGGITSHKGILQGLQCYSIPGSRIILGEGRAKERMRSAETSLGVKMINPIDVGMISHPQKDQV